MEVATVMSLVCGLSFLSLKFVILAITICRGLRGDLTEKLRTLAADSLSFKAAMLLIMHKFKP